MMKNDAYVGIDASSDFLMHYGVKGMKWGHKKSDSPSFQSKTNLGSSRDGTYANGWRSEQGIYRYTRPNRQKLTPYERKYKTVDTMRGKKRQGGR